MTLRNCFICGLVSAIATLSTGLLTSGLLSAQEAESPNAAGATAAVSGAEGFDSLFAEWKKTLGELQEIRLKFQSEVSDEKKLALREEFTKKVEQGNEIVPKLVAAGEKAYQAAPAQNKDLEVFLVGVSGDYAASDRYQDAFRISKMLIEGGTKNENLHLIAGASAVAVHEFELADKYLLQAKEEGALNPTPQQGNPAKARIAQTAMGYMRQAEQVREAWTKEQEIRKAEAEADDLPRVKIETSAGDMVIELYENEAPQAVANFVSLVEKGFYNGLTFHRVLPNFMAQGGCPQGTGTGGPGYNIPCECHQDNYRRHFSGTLSMAHAGRDTGGSQFFLTFVPTSMLDGRHTAFGRVIEGMDVLPKITRIDPQNPRPEIKASKIVKATVLRKRDHAYEPKKLPGR